MMFKYVFVLIIATTTFLANAQTTNQPAAPATQTTQAVTVTPVAQTAPAQTVTAADIAKLEAIIKEQSTRLETLEKQKSTTEQIAEKAQGFYSNSFNWLLAFFGIIVTLFIAFFGVSQLFQWLDKRKFEKLLKEQEEKIKASIATQKEQEKKINESIATQNVQEKRVYESIRVFNSGLANVIYLIMHKDDQDREVLCLMMIVFCSLNSNRDVKNPIDLLCKKVQEYSNFNDYKTIYLHLDNLKNYITNSMENEIYASYSNQLRGYINDIENIEILLKEKQMQEDKFSSTANKK